MSSNLHSESSSDKFYSSYDEILSITSESSLSNQYMSLLPERCLDDSPVVDTVGTTDSLNEELDDHIDASYSDDSLLDDYSDSDDKQIENYNPHLYQPLYSGAEITICGAICAIMQFCTTYKLSYTAIGGLLRLLIILCPTPTICQEVFIC